MDTLEIITDLPYTRLKGLKEWNFGTLEGKDTASNPPSPFGEFFKNYGGEGQDEFVNRIVSTMKDIMEKETGTVLVVSHGLLVLVFLITLMNIIKSLHIRV